MVYLIHFDQKYKHAQHYIGFVEKNLDERMKRHRAGIGAKLLKVVNNAGINYEVVKVWEDGSRDFERSLKNKKKSSCLCPICKNIKNANNTNSK